MIIDIECPTCHGQGEVCGVTPNRLSRFVGYDDLSCHGQGEVCGVTPNRRSRFVGYDDLSPDDYTRTCPHCLGTGTVEHDLNEDCDDE